MSRTTKYKAGYLVVIAVPILALAVGYYCLRPPLAVLFLVAGVLLIPSRIQGLYWRDFFRGRRLLATKDYRAAIVHFERFVAQLRDRPWLKKLIWLNWSMYTRSIEAMALNNLGAARLHLGDVEAARQTLADAVEIDPDCPLPYFNLALIERLRGCREEADDLLAKARRLGYSAATTDRLIAGLGTALAGIEGLRSSAPPAGHCIYCGYNLTGNVSGRCPECGTAVSLGSAAAYNAQTGSKDATHDPGHRSHLR